MLFRHHHEARRRCSYLYIFCHHSSHSGTNRIDSYARHHRAAQADGITVLTTTPGVPEILSMVRDVDSCMPLCEIMWIPYLSECEKQIIESCKTRNIFKAHPDSSRTLYACERELRNRVAQA